MVFTSKFVSKNTKTTIQSLVALFFASNSVLWYSSTTHTKRLRGTLYSVHIMLYMACRVHSIEYNLRSFFLLFLPPFPSSPNFHTLHHQHWGRRVLLMQKQEEFIWALPAKIEPPCPQRMGKGRVDWNPPSSLADLLWSKNVQYCRGSNSQV